MKKKGLLTGMFCLVLVFAFLVTGCTTTNLKTNIAGEYNMIPKIASKDFVVLGLVSVNTSVVESTSAFRLNSSVEGERITFDRLLQEARRLYPDVSDIINVRVDRVVRGKTSLLDFFTGSSRTVEYLGNALAIRYTGALSEGETPISGRTNTLP